MSARQAAPALRSGRPLTGARLPTEGEGRREKGQLIEVQGEEAMTNADGLAALPDVREAEPGWVLHTCALFPSRPFTE